MKRTLTYDLLSSIASRKKSKINENLYELDFSNGKYECWSIILNLYYQENQNCYRTFSKRSCYKCNPVFYEADWKDLYNCNCESSSRHKQLFLNVRRVCKTFDKIVKPIFSIDIHINNGAFIFNSLCNHTNLLFSAINNYDLIVDKCEYLDKPYFYKEENIKKIKSIMVQNQILPFFSGKPTDFKILLKYVELNPKIFFKFKNFKEEQGLFKYCKELETIYKRISYISIELIAPDNFSQFIDFLNHTDIKTLKHLDVKFNSTITNAYELSLKKLLEKYKFISLCFTFLNISELEKQSISLSKYLDMSEMKTLVYKFDDS